MGVCISHNNNRNINNKDIKREGHFPGHSKSIPLKNMEIIIEQTKKNVFKIVNPHSVIGSGFICIIPFPDQLSRLQVLITCHHILSREDIAQGKEIELKNRDITKKIKIDESRLTFASEEEKYDITIIEIKKDDNFDLNNMLEIDNDLFINKKLDSLYKNRSVYLIHYPLGSEANYSTDVIKSIDSNNIRIMHQCSTESGSSGGPILDSKTLKVIGVHIGKHSTFNVNIGTIIKKPIEDFYKKYNICNDNIDCNTCFDSDKNSAILIYLKINKEDINKKIYFLDNTNYTENDTKKRHFHDNLNVLNSNNVKLFINNKKQKFKKFFIPKKEGEYTIKLILSNQIDNCSYMFYWCVNIIKLDLSFFKSKNVKNMSEMFSNCKNLEKVNLSSFNTENVINMSSMFSNCENLKYLDLSSFNTGNVINMSSMFYGCKNLRNLDLSKFNTEKVTDINHMFSYCENLDYINLSNFETKNVINMGFIFSYCKNLVEMDITPFNCINKDAYINDMFYDCNKLTKIISNKIFYKKIMKDIKSNIEVTLK